MHPRELNNIPENELAQLLKSSSLSYREREVVKLIGGLSVGDGYEYTTKEVAHIFKVTAQKIDTIVEKAMRKIERQRTTQHSAEDLLPESSAIIVSVGLPEFIDETFAAQKLVDLYIALNGMHIGAGGTGLVVNDEQSCSATIKLEGAPIR